MIRAMPKVGMTRLLSLSREPDNAIYLQMALILAEVARILFRCQYVLYEGQPQMHLLLWKQ